MLPRSEPARSATAGPALTASVVIAAHATERWAMLVAAIESVLAQTCRPVEVLVAVDHNDALLCRLREEFPHVRAVPNTRSPGAAGTRNAGAAVATGDTVAFL